mmetsp:Transcript_15682/g.20453  ORF Transcript_15682/g.20453 Transcript_15682/m.20453 type:complete len:85 (+) Transcript_15682:144-398(+)
MGQHPVICLINCLLAILVASQLQQQACAFTPLSHSINMKVACGSPKLFSSSSSSNNGNVATTTICPEIPLMPQPGLEMAIVSLG